MVDSITTPERRGAKRASAAFGAICLGLAVVCACPSAKGKTRADDGAIAPKEEPMAAPLEPMAAAEAPFVPLIAVAGAEKPPVTSDKGSYYRYESLFEGRSSVLSSPALQGEPDTEEALRELHERQNKATREDSSGTFEAVSADGSRVAHATEDGLVYLYRRGARDKALLLDLGYHNGKFGSRLPRCMAWSDSGRYFALGYAASVEQGGGVVLVDAETAAIGFHPLRRQPVMVLPSSKGALYFMEFGFISEEAGIEASALVSESGNRARYIGLTGQAVFTDGGNRFVTRTVRDGVADTYAFDLERGLFVPAFPADAELAKKAGYPRLKAFSGDWKAPAVSSTVFADRLEEGAPEEPMEKPGFPVRLPPSVDPRTWDGLRSGLVYEGADLEARGAFRTGDGAAFVLTCRSSEGPFLALAYTGKSGALSSRATARVEGDGLCGFDAAIAHGNDAFFCLDREAEGMYVLTRIGRTASKDGDWRLKFKGPDAPADGWDVRTTQDGGCLVALSRILEKPALCLARFTGTGELAWTRSAPLPEYRMEGRYRRDMICVGLDGDHPVALVHDMEDAELRLRASPDSAGQRMRSGLLYLRIAPDGGSAQAFRLGKNAIPFEDEEFTWNNGAFIGSATVLKPESGRLRIISFDAAPLSGKEGATIRRNDNLMLAWAKEYADQNPGKFSGIAAWDSGFSRLWLIPYARTGGSAYISTGIEFCVDAFGYGVFVEPSDSLYGSLPEGSLCLVRAALGSGDGWHPAPGRIDSGWLVDSIPLGMEASADGIAEVRAVGGLSIRRDVPELRQVEYRDPEAIGAPR